MQRQNSYQEVTMREHIAGNSTCHSTADFLLEFKDMTDVPQLQGCIKEIFKWRTAATE